MKYRIALIGFGALSRIFLDVFHKNLTDRYSLCGIYTRTIPENKEGFRFFDRIEDLVAEKPEYVLEFAGGNALRAYGPSILQAGCNLIAVSIGALADEDFYHQLEKIASEQGCKLYLPSGAVGGFDVLRTMSLAGTDRITIENRKAPASLNGAPYLQGKNLPSDEEVLVFQGSARQAIAAFPQNVNVAVAAALAAANVDTAQVEIRSIPGLLKNTHIIHAENQLADVRLEFSSKPDPSNPKSSTITAWSAAALLLNLASPIQFF